MSARRVVPRPVGRSPIKDIWLASPLISLPVAAPGPKPPGVAAATPVSKLRRTRAEASSSAVSPTRRCCAFHSARPALTPWVSPTTRKPSTTTTTIISSRVNPLWRTGARSPGTAESTADAGGAETQRPQHHLALVTMRLPRDCHLDIEQAGRLWGDPVRPHTLPLRHRLNAQLPTVAAAVISARFSLNQRGVASDCREVGLRALQRLLDPSGGVDGEQTAAPGLKQANQRQRGDRERDDDLEQGEAGCGRGAFNAHRQP